MSYEGSEIKICENGHLSFEECNYSMGDPDHCHCGRKIVWERSIDNTNCESYGDFPLGFFKIKTGAVQETCPTCSHTKLLYEATYEIPTCSQCGSHNIRSNRYFNGKDFVGSVKCEDCGMVLFGEPLTP